MASDKKEFFVSLDLKNNSVLNFVADPVESVPSSGAKMGQLKTHAGKLYVGQSDGSYVELGAAGDASQIATDLAALSTKVEGVKTTAETATTNISNLTDRVNIAEGEINTLQSSLETAEGEINTLQSDMTTAKDDISKLKTTVGDAESGLVKDVADNAATLANKANSADVYTKTVIDGKVSALETSIGTKADADNVYTKSEIDTSLGLYRTIADSYDKTTVDKKISNAVSSTYKVKGTIANANALPTGAQTGDVYNITAASTYGPAGTNVVWDGTAWDALGGIMDLTDYATTTYVDGKVRDLTTAIGKKVDQTAYDSKIGTIDNTLSSHTTLLGGLRDDVDAKVAKTDYESKVASLESSIAGKATKVATGVGTWTGKITVNAEGIVTAGANLVAADIPSITAEKISDFTSKARNAVRYKTTSASGAIVNVAHNLNVDFPHVTVYNSGGEEIGVHVKVTDSNNVVVSGNEDLGAITIVVSA